MASASVRPAADRNLRRDDLFCGLAGGAAGPDPPAGAACAADLDAGDPPLAKAAARGNGERCAAVDRAIRRLLLDAVLPDALGKRRAGKGAIAPCPPSKPCSQWWARFACPPYSS